MESCKGCYDNLPLLFGEAQGVLPYGGNEIPIYHLKKECAEEILSLVFPTQEARKLFEGKSLAEQLAQTRLHIEELQYNHDLPFSDENDIRVTAVVDLKPYCEKGRRPDRYVAEKIKGLLTYEGLLLGILLPLGSLHCYSYTERFLLWLGSTVPVFYEFNFYEDSEGDNERFAIYTLAYPAPIMREDIDPPPLRPKAPPQKKEECQQKYRSIDEVIAGANRGDPEAKAILKKLYDFDAAFKIPTDTTKDS